MTEPRVTTSLLVSALRRRAEAEGGYATILAKGDPTAGSLLIVLSEKGGGETILERTLGPAGNYSWTRVENQAARNEGEAGKFLQRSLKYDPDLWIIELTTASAERFIDALNDFV